MSEELTVENGCKIFVGNVPFQCTREDFQSCFSNMEGFVTADIIRRFRSKISRGFGFVVFGNQEQANKLLLREDITLKDRTLRFSTYDSKTEEDNTEQSVRQQRQQKPKERYFTIFVKGLPNETSSEQLAAMFQQYGEMLSASVYERDGRYTGVVTMKTEEGYNNALNGQYDNNVNVYPYRRRKQQKHFIGYTDPKVAYREGMKAGQIIGYKEGYDSGYTDCQNGVPRKN